MDSCKRESSPSPSSSTCRPKYDVFLSFRGKDTRHNFTDHLYDALNRKGIITFRDKEELKKGESNYELFKAIEESQSAIIILSKNYASSKWCLDELAKIIKCREETGLKVFPVFYHVEPADVGKQTGPFGQAFRDHQNRVEYNTERVETWRASLGEVAKISGWPLQNRYESKIIQHIVKEILQKLSFKSSSIDKNLIGIKSMAEKLIHSYLGFGNNIYMMGICGMGGLGKTTLASALYHEYSNHFEGSSFIANVRERSEKGELHELQQQLLDEILEGSNTKIYNVQVGVKTIKSSGLRHKKVLLVLDDVNHKDQLEKLAGENDWFGLGSWIIITTRDEHVLVNHGVLKIYKPNGLDDEGASKLFCLKAFKKEQPEEGYMRLSQKVVEYASGLPLALVTLGSFLAGRTIDEWNSALNSFKKTKGEIFDILKISYDGLDERWKEIFLDIACFFRGWNKDKVIQILENCGFDAKIGISVLVERSLVTINNRERLGMHDLLQEMGEKIVHFELGGKLGKQSRLWLIKDLLHLLKNDMAPEAIQAIVLRYKKNDFNFEELPEVLSKMSNLRLMIIDKTDYQGHPAVPNDQRQLFVSNQLRHLSWSYCPLQCLSSSSKPKELVRLDLQYSRIEYLWEGVMRAVNLKFIDLSGSNYLIRTPDFSGVPILEGLNLSRCGCLVEIHPSIGQLSKLRYLHLDHCSSLTGLPRMSAEMQSLMVLNLYRCSKISTIPKFTGIMKSLSELNLGGTAIKNVTPSSIECLPVLTFLDLSGCRNLETLIIRRCSKLKSLPRLPSTVIRAQFCSSLKWIPERVKLSIWSQLLSQWLPYDEILFFPKVGFTILCNFLQGLLCRKAILYGSIIPSCLIQIVRNSLSIELPSNSEEFIRSKWIGFALWATISCILRRDSIRVRVIALGDMPRNHRAFELFATLIICEVNICLLYLSRDDWLAKVGNGECSKIEVIFGGDIDVRLCGVSLIYKQDVDEFSQTNEQCLIESFGEEVSIYKLTECGMAGE